jgi:hypothetical protein
VPEPEEAEERAPVFGSWKRLYAAVVTYLFGLILLFYWFTVTFNHPQ